MMNNRPERTYEEHLNQGNLLLAQLEKEIGELNNKLKNAREGDANDLNAIYEKITNGVYADVEKHITKLINLFKTSESQFSEKDKEELRIASKTQVDKKNNSMKQLNQACREIAEIYKQEIQILDQEINALSKKETEIIRLRMDLTQDYNQFAYDMINYFNTLPEENCLVKEQIAGVEVKINMRALYVRAAEMACEQVYAGELENIEQYLTLFDSCYAEVLNSKVHKEKAANYSIKNPVLCYYPAEPFKPVAAPRLAVAEEKLDLQLKAPISVAPHAGLHLQPAPNPAPAEPAVVNAEKKSCCVIS